MLAGVLQGSLFSPLLYNLYTSDIPKSMSELALYADDICIYDLKKPKYTCPSVEHRLNDIWSWASRSRIKINGDKSSAIAFSGKHKISVPKLTLDNVQIDYVQEYSYLGVHLHNRLTVSWTGHSEALRTKAL
jgi:Reverse transcriptase (RNA-dependent DNA polymerase).